MTISVSARLLYTWSNCDVIARAEPRHARFKLKLKRWLVEEMRLHADHVWQCTATFFPMLLLGNFPDFPVKRGKLLTFAFVAYAYDCAVVKTSFFKRSCQFDFNIGVLLKIFFNKVVLWLSKVYSWRINSSCISFKGSKASPYAQAIFQPGNAENSPVYDPCCEWSGDFMRLFHGDFMAIFLGDLIEILETFYWQQLT